MPLSKIVSTRIIPALLATAVAQSSYFSWGQESKPQQAPAVEPAASPAKVPSMRKTNPPVMEPTAPGAPGTPLPIQPSMQNEPLFIPDINAPNAIPQLPSIPSGATPGVVARSPLERKYTIGKINVKYGTDVQVRNPKLPAEDELAASEVKLLNVPGKGLFHIAKNPAPEAAKPQGGLLATTTAEQNQSTEVHDEDPAFRPLLPVVETPAAPALARAKKPAKPSKEEKAAPRGIPKAAAVGAPLTLKISDFSEPQEISALALLDVYDALVRKLTDRGLIGVYVLADINPRKGVDGREAGVMDVNVSVFISEVAKIRTIARRIPYRLALPKINDDDAPDGQPIKDPKHLWIKEKSPIFVSDPKKPGGPLEKPRLQDYLSRLNRFPGRRVDAAINATGETGKVMLDYLIREQKNYVIYAQESNNGTKSTGEWRSRIGLELRQLANMDDVLRMEYTTTDFSRFNSGVLSYQAALAKPDLLKMRIYGLYGQFSAEDVGFAGATFTGDSLAAGLALTWTPLYWHGFPIDLTAGGEFTRVTVNNEATGGKSAVNFILPYISIGTERTTDKSSLLANIQVKGSFDQKNQDQLNGLGRFDADGSFFYGNADLAASVYLEPLLLGKKWGDLGKDGTNWKRGILANELALLVHSQYAMGNRRLVPQFALIAGGAGSVRGYPESFTAGDSGFVSSLEYRLHVPRLFKPSETARLQKAAAEKAAAARTAANPTKPVKVSGTQRPGGPVAPSQPELATEVKQERAGASPSFNLRPAAPGAGADWDLIVRAFLDYGQTYNNRAQTTVEVDRTLMSVGGGLELQMFKLPGKGGIPLYMTVRADYGVVLESQTTLLLDPVESGDTRLHLSATIAW